MVFWTKQINYVLPSGKLDLAILISIHLVASKKTAINFFFHLHLLHSHDFHSKPPLFTKIHRKSAITLHLTNFFPNALGCFVPEHP